MVDGDLVPGGGGIGLVHLDGICELELALLSELEDGDGSELLGDGPEAELGFARVGDVPFGVGEAIALAQQGLAVLGDEDDTAELTVADPALDVAVGLGGEVLGAGERSDTREPQEAEHTRRYDWRRDLFEELIVLQGRRTRNGE